MAAPYKNRAKEGHQKTIDKIRTTQLVKRLQCHALNEKDDAGNDVKLDNSQIRAIEILIKKTIPDLSNTKLSGDEDNPLSMSITEIALVAPKNDAATD